MSYVANFLDYLTFEKRYSPNTITSYKIDLDQFLHYLNIEKNDKQIADISHKTIRLWIIKLIQKNISARTVNRKISTLKSFYNYLMKRDIIAFNPIDKMVKPKFSKPLPSFISAKQMLKLINYDKFSDSFADQRDKLILEIFFDTGIRLNELKNLKFSDIDFFAKTIKIKGKGNKERLIPISDKLIQSINKYRQLILSTFSAEKKYLILTEKGLQAYDKLIYKSVKKWFSKIITKGKISPHMIRHTFATSLLNNGADLNAVKSLLGHSNLSATQIYTHHTFDKIMKTYNQAHPKA